MCKVKIFSFHSSPNVSHKHIKCLLGWRTVSECLTKSRSSRLSKCVHIAKPIYTILIFINLLSSKYSGFFPLFFFLWFVQRPSFTWRYWLSNNFVYSCRYNLRLQWQQTEQKTTGQQWRSQVKETHFYLEVTEFSGHK